MNARSENLQPISTDQPPTLSEREFFITVYPNERATTPKLCAPATVAQLRSFLRKRDIRPRKSGLGFSLAKILEGGRRCNADVLFRSGIECDIDAGATYAELQSAVAPFTHFAYSTHSHDPENGRHKFRIVMPFSRDVQPVEWPLVWAGTNVLLGGHLDPACKDISRFVYFASCPPETAAQAFAVANAGALLDPDYLIGLASASAGRCVNDSALTGTGSSPETPDEIARVNSMLVVIPADCSFDVWRSVVWGIASTGWECAETLAREWSQTAPHRFDESTFRRIWSSYDLDHPNAVGFGTLVRLARQHGWMPATKTPDLASAEPGDIIAGRLYAGVARSRLRFCNHAGRWLNWDGIRWEWASQGQEMALAKDVADRILLEASRLFAQDSARNGKRLKFAMALQNLARLEVFVPTEFQAF